jgi:hypothetical protein
VSSYLDRIRLRIRRYRIGDFIVTDENWPQKRPPAQGPYPLTDPFPKKYLYDRPELDEPLGQYLRGLRSRVK